jgi:hypothetical protein
MKAMTTFRGLPQKTNPLPLNHAGCDDSDTNVFLEVKRRSADFLNYTQTKRATSLKRPFREIGCDDAEDFIRVTAT